MHGHAHGFPARPLWLACVTSCSIAVSTNQSGTGRPERALGMFLCASVCGVYRQGGISVKRFAPLREKKEKLTQCEGHFFFQKGQRDDKEKAEKE